MAERRQLKFDTLADAARDAEALLANGYEAIGKWTLAQLRAPDELAELSDRRVPEDSVGAPAGDVDAPEHGRAVEVRHLRAGAELPGRKADHPAKCADPRR